MTHESLERRKAPQGSSDRSFGIVFAIAFAVIAVWPLFFGEQLRWWSALMSAIILAVAFTRADVLRPANKLWTRLGALLHKIVNPIVLGVMFFLVVLPTGLLMGLFRKDPLRTRYDKTAGTYWIERGPTRDDRVSLKDQF